MSQTYIKQSLRVDIFRIYYTNPAQRQKQMIRTSRVSTYQANRPAPSPAEIKQANEQRAIYEKTPERIQATANFNQAIAYANQLSKET